MSQVLHFVLCDHGKHGLAWAERSPADMTRAETIRDIKHGQLENVRQVLEVDMTASPIMSRDVTAEILKAVADDCGISIATEVNWHGRKIFHACDDEGHHGFGITPEIALEDCREAQRAA